MSFQFPTKCCEWRGRLDVDRKTVPESRAGSSKLTIADSNKSRRTDVKETGGRRAQPASTSRRQIGDVLKLARYERNDMRETSGRSKLTKGRIAAARERYSLYFTIGQLFFPPQNCPLYGGSEPHLMHGSLGPTESTSQIASRRVQLFLQSSRSWQTDRQTTLLHL